MSFLKPRKRFGQNFLIDFSVLAHLAQSIAPQKEDYLFEIGPGRGALTHALQSFPVRGGCALEIDRDLYQFLKAQWNLDGPWILLQGDALSFDYTYWHSKNHLQNGLRIVGNLPYNISTPLLFHLLQHRACVQDMHVMLQKEMADRLAAQPNTPAYSQLSVIMQYHCDVRHLFDVPSSAFYPKPQVESAVVCLKPWHDCHRHGVDESVFTPLVKRAFQQRRKTLKNNLKGLLSADAIAHAGVCPTGRPESLSVADYIRLSQVLAGLKTSLGQDNGV